MPSMKVLNAMPRKDACKYIMHVIFAMLPSKGNHTVIIFKGTYNSKRLIKQCLYCCICYVIQYTRF